MQSNLEIECKFTLAGETIAKALMGLTELAGFSLGPSRAENATDVYFDTGDRRLYAAGWSFRWRSAEGAVRATLKSLDFGEGVGRTRRECEEEIASGIDAPNLPPGLLSGKLDELSGGKKLRPLVSVEQRRCIRPLAQGSLHFADFYVDEVRTEALESWWEAEVECVAEGQESLLGPICAALLGMEGVSAERRSKFERALAAADAAGQEETAGKSGGPGPGDPLEAYAAWALRETLKALLDQLSHALTENNPDAVHDARIAARRLRVYMDIFHDELEPSMSKRTDRRLRRLCQALGEVRDIDVILADARAHHLRLKGSKAEAFAVFLRDLECRRDRAMLSLAERAGPRKIENLRKDIRLMARTASRDNDRHTRRPAGLDAGALLVPAFADLMEFTPLMLAGRAGDPVCHDARRKAKRLRYALEAFEPLYGEALGFFIGQLKDLQDRLGGLTDVVAASRAAADYVAALTDGERRGTETPGLLALPSVVAYLEQKQRHSARLSGLLPTFWAKMATPAFRKRFFAMLGSCPIVFDT